MSSLPLLLFASPYWAARMASVPNSCRLSFRRFQRHSLVVKFVSHLLVSCWHFLLLSLCLEVLRLARRQVIQVFHAAPIVHKLLDSGILQLCKIVHPQAVPDESVQRPRCKVLARFFLLLKVPECNQVQLLAFV